MIFRCFASSPCRKTGAGGRPCRYCMIPYILDILLDFAFAILLLFYILLDLVFAILLFDILFDFVLTALITDILFDFVLCRVIVVIIFEFVLHCVIVGILFELHCVIVGILFEFVLYPVIGDILFDSSFTSNPEGAVSSTGSPSKGCTSATCCTSCS